MRRFFLFLAMLAIAAPAAAAQIIYVGNRTATDIGGTTTSVDYSITTNGSTGVLSQSDITAYSLTFNQGGVSTTFTNTNPAISLLLSGGSLSATATDLAFNFVNPATFNQDFLLFYTNNGGVLCFANANCGNMNPDIQISFNSSTSLTTQPLGLSVIASAQAPLPEPATWAMMLLGFGAIGLSLRQRRRVALSQLA